jgi:hypothetical protein
LRGAGRWGKTDSAKIIAVRQQAEQFLKSLKIDWGFQAELGP